MSGSGLITPLRGASIDRVAVDNFHAYYIGFHRGKRDTWLVVAHCDTDYSRRADHIRYAMREHRQMMRQVFAARVDALDEFTPLDTNGHPKRVSP